VTFFRPNTTSRVAPWLATFAFAVSSMALIPDARGDEPPVKETKPEDAVSKRLHEFSQKSAADYELFRDELKKEPLTLVPQAVFHWKHDNDWRGDVFVWIYEGRPEVLGGVFFSPPSGNSRTVNHEFYSLALQPIGAIKTPRGTWKAESGIRLTPVPDAKPPATSEPLRGAQLREMARQFTVTMKDDEGQPWELRLLPQPLYRYSSPSQKVLDGALFTYVWTKGTDPDCVLLVEARDDGNGPKWVYTPVRMTFRALEMKHAGHSVWISERNAPDPLRPEPYTWFPVGILPIAEEPK
jgi:hypothetical protein